MSPKLDEKNRHLLKKIRSKNYDSNFISGMSEKRLFQILLFLYVFDKKDYLRLTKNISQVIFKRLNFDLRKLKGAVGGKTGKKKKKKGKAVKAFQFDMCNPKPMEEEKKNLPKENVLTNFLEPVVKKEIEPKREPVEFSYENQLIKRGFGIKIYERDYHMLKINRAVTQNVLNYYLNYITELNEKTNKMILKKYKLRIIVFKTFLMDIFTEKGRMEPEECSFKNIQFYGDKYEYCEETLFKNYDQLLIPFNDKKGHYKLVLVNLHDKIVRLYDPLKTKPLSGEDDSRYKYISYSLNFIREFVFYKKNIREESKWTVQDNESSSLGNLAYTSISTCFFAHCILKGNIYPVCKIDLLDVFYDKLLDIISDQALEKNLF